jgi:ATP-binding cassette subfamily C (CFTR/MRP) protein 4
VRQKSIAFLTLLSYYDEDRSGESVFGSEEEFWMVEGVLIGLHFVFLFIKYSLFSLVILNFTSHIHQQMLHSFIRSCNSFYDITPMGQLTNKFSNDVGVLDNSLIFTLIQAFDASIFCFVLMINTFIISPFFIIVVAVIALPSLLALYIGLKPVILESKQMDLKQKSPVFTLLTQTIQGLLQLRLFSTQHRYVRTINQAIDRALEANLFFWFSSRLLGVYVSIIMNIVIAIGIFIGIAVLPDSTHSQSEIDEATGLYAVSVASFLFFLDLMQWCIRQIMTTESMMVSVQRCFAMIDVEHEKPIITDYDRQMGLLDGKEEGRMTES